MHSIQSTTKTNNQADEMFPCITSTTSKKKESDLKALIDTSEQKTVKVSSLFFSAIAAQQQYLTIPYPATEPYIAPSFNLDIEEKERQDVAALPSKALKILSFYSKHGTICQAPINKRTREYPELLPKMKRQKTSIAVVNSLIENLPKDIFHKIGNYLSVQDHYSLALASHTLNAHSLMYDIPRIISFLRNKVWYLSNKKTKYFTAYCSVFNKRVVNHILKKSNTKLDDLISDKHMSKKMPLDFYRSLWRNAPFDIATLLKSDLKPRLTNKEQETLQSFATNLLEVSQNYNLRYALTDPELKKLALFANEYIETHKNNFYVKTKCTDLATSKFTKERHVFTTTSSESKFPDGYQFIKALYFIKESLREFQTEKEIKDVQDFLEGKPWLTYYLLKSTPSPKFYDTPSFLDYKYSTFPLSIDKIPKNFFNNIMHHPKKLKRILSPRVLKQNKLDNGYLALPQTLRNNNDFNLQAVKYCPQLLKHSRPFKANKELILNYISNNPCSFLYLSQNIKNTSDFSSYAYEKILDRLNQFKDYDMFKQALFQIFSRSDDVKIKKNIFKIACRFLDLVHIKNYMKNVPAELIEDVAFLEICLEELIQGMNRIKINKTHRDEMIIEFANLPLNIKKNRLLCLRLLQENSQCIVCIDPSLLVDVEICKTAFDNRIGLFSVPNAILTAVKPQLLPIQQQKVEFLQHLNNLSAALQPDIKKKAAYQFLPKVEALKNKLEATSPEQIRQELTKLHNEIQVEQETVNRKSR